MYQEYYKTNIAKMKSQNILPDLRDFYIPLPQNILPVDHPILIDIFKKNIKERLKPYFIKDVKGHKLGKRDYWEMYFPYKEFKELFIKMFPFPLPGLSIHPPAASL